MLEALPSPYGLVRSGVAPDHGDTKNVVHQFREVMRAGVVRYFGNVRVGGSGGAGGGAGGDTTTSTGGKIEKKYDVGLSELRGLYDAVVLSCGAGGGKRLGVVGGGLGNVVSAREFVNWYNGGIDTVMDADGRKNADVIQSCLSSRIEKGRVRSVVVCGLGNVALDCARVLLKDAETALHPTDMVSRAVRALARGRVEEVHVLSRRGPAQAACTPKELREVLGLPGVRVRVHPEGVLDGMGPRCLEELEGSRIHRRVVDVLRTKAGGVSGGGDTIHTENETKGKELHFHFLSSPAKYEGGGDGDGDGEGLVATTVVERMALDGGGGGGGGGGEPRAPQRAVRTGETFRIPSDLVIESVGYKAVPMEGAPFDEVTGTVPNVLGRVTFAGGEHGDGSERERDDLYCCGWLKRGPTGIIGTNLVDAEQTVDTMVRHVRAKVGPRSGEAWGRAGLSELLRARKTRVVTFDAWERIDAEEVRRGEEIGKVREKFVDVDEMLAHCNAHAHAQ